MSLIFISIASYRDEQIVPTVLDALAKAAHPDDLRFGIVHQRGDDEPELPFKNDLRFRILDVNWRDSAGVCWARSEAMKLYDGEDWFLQVDAHMRWAQGWDVALIDEATRAESANPVLTGYPPPFCGDGSFVTTPRVMVIDDFSRDGLPHLFGIPMSDVDQTWERRTSPIRARFVSGGFIFAEGSFVETVPADPTLYYDGEEITTSVRAWTHGFDLFHLTVPQLWHLYASEFDSIRPRHWNDHPTGRQQHHASVLAVRQFLHAPPMGRFGIGTARSFDSYQRFIGVDFSQQCCTRRCRLGMEPPDSTVPDGWAQNIAYYDCQINVAATEVAGDCTSWWIHFWDAERELVYRRFVRPFDFITSGGYTRLELRFACETPPVYWCLQQHSRAHGWMPAFRVASPNAFVWIRRTGPYEVLDWRYDVRQRERAAAERAATDIIDRMIARPMTGERTDLSRPNHHPSAESNVDEACVAAAT